MINTALALIFSAFALGCSSGEPSASLSQEPTTAHKPSATSVLPLSAVGNATPGTKVTVKGFLFYYADKDTYQLSSSMCESYPPQACGDNTWVLGLDKAQASAVLTVPQDAQFAHTQWSNRSVTVSGVINKAGGIDAISVQ